MPAVSSEMLSNLIWGFLIMGLILVIVWGFAAAFNMLAAWHWNRITRKNHFDHIVAEAEAVLRDAE